MGIVECVTPKSHKEVGKACRKVLLDLVVRMLKDLFLVGIVALVLLVALTTKGNSALLFQDAGYPALTDDYADLVVDAPPSIGSLVVVEYAKYWIPVGLHGTNLVEVAGLPHVGSTQQAGE